MLAVAINSIRQREQNENNLKSTKLFKRYSHRDFGKK